MDTKIQVLLAVLLICVLVIIITAAVRRIKRKVRQVSRMAFGTDSLVEGWQKQAKELSVTPKSVSGMTRIYEPQIQRDFPEFNWVQFKNKAENMLISAFAAISEGRSELLQEAAPELSGQIQNRIIANRQAEVTETYRQVKIHRTEIARYEKKQGKCIITLQSAVEHYHYKEQYGKLLEGSRELLEQTKYNTELMYVQNAKEANLDRSVGVTCPHCGAPVTMLGEDRHCEYCGSPVVPINIQVWTLHKFYEVDYHHV